MKRSESRKRDELATHTTPVADLLPGHFPVFRDFNACIMCHPFTGGAENRRTAGHLLTPCRDNLYCALNILHHLIKAGSPYFLCFFKLHLEELKDVGCWDRGERITMCGYIITFAVSIPGPQDCLEVLREYVGPERSRCEDKTTCDGGGSPEPLRLLSRDNLKFTCATLIRGGYGFVCGVVLFHQLLVYYRSIYTFTLDVDKNTKCAEKMVSRTDQMESE